MKIEEYKEVIVVLSKSGGKQSNSNELKSAYDSEISIREVKYKDNVNVSTKH